MSDPIAVIADVHGNADALAAVLADIDAQGITTILNLGDHLSGPLAAAETAEMILARDMINIRGNHDRYLIELTRDKMGPSDQVAFDQLSETHLAWLRSLPATRVLSDQIFLCHGTPSSDGTYFLEQVLAGGDITLRAHPDIESDAAGITQPLILCAHTHTARAVRLDDGRLIVNPGSVGLPAYDDDAPVYHVMETGLPDACYALVQQVNGAWRVDFKTVPYDASRMTQCARDAGRPDWANAVSTGWFQGKSQAAD
ncbi:MAG: metallophosphoesterase [Sedimentitalea sp.]